ncbi:MAG: ribosome silencing factor [Thiomargarita sp.]|nr:ribosome silencing factor [Thiomargarita sp.]
MIDATNLLTIVQDALEDKKAQDITILDVRKRSSITDFMVVATGRTARQVIALAQNVIQEAKSFGHRPLGEEGRDVGEWVLVDLGDILVHIMQAETRDFYQLEKLWKNIED